MSSIFLNILACAEAGNVLKEVARQLHGFGLAQSPIACSSLEWNGLFCQKTLPLPQVTFPQLPSMPSLVITLNKGR